MTIYSISYARKDVSGMIIKASGVSMHSERSHSDVTIIQTASALTRGGKLAGSWSIQTAVSASASGSSQNNVEITLSERSKELLKQLQQQEKQEKKENKQNAPWITGEQVKGAGQSAAPPVAQSEEDVQIQTLRRLLESLKRMRECMQSGKWSLDPVRVSREQRKVPTQSRNLLGRGMTLSLSGSVSMASVSVATGTAPVASGVWTRQTVTSSFHAETENTAFCSTGIVKTADGREIGFNVQVEMSRSFLEANTCITEEVVQIMTDPLVINLDTDVAQISDQKFLFDLDADGTADQISFATGDSGFLAVDRNGDGQINDGTELFGTQSGDGFADLAVYDEDGNGWIDEADSVFHHLLIWSKDEKGADKLVGIGKAGIGALYLGSASTEFSLKAEETNMSNGQIRRTGVYLRESGEVGTMQHVDLAL